MYGTAITARSQYGVLMMALLACFLVIVPSNSPKIDFFPFKIDFSIPHYIHHPPILFPFSICPQFVSVWEALPAKSLMRAQVNRQLSMITATPSSVILAMHCIGATKCFKNILSPIFILSMTFMLLSPPVESNQLLWRDSIRLDVFIMDMSVPICPLDNLKLIWHLPPNWKQLGK